MTDSDTTVVGDTPSGKDIRLVISASALGTCSLHQPWTCNSRSINNR